MTRLKEQYDSQIKAAMMKKFGYKNEMQIPKLVKIVVNMGVGDAKENHKLLDSAIGDMEKITGQKAVVCKAKTKEPVTALSKKLSLRLKPVMTSLSSALISTPVSLFRRLSLCLPLPASPSSRTKPWSVPMPSRMRPEFIRTA